MKVGFRMWMTSVVFFVVLLTVVVMLLYAIPVARERLEGYDLDRLTAQAAVTADAIAESEGRDLEPLLGLAADPDDTEALFVDRDGNVLERAGPDLLGDDPRILQEAAGGGRLFEEAGRLGLAVVPVFYEGDLAGGVVLASRETESDVFGFFYRSALEAALVASALGGALMLLLASLLSRRVERLASGARAIEGGDLSHRIESGFGDELGELARAFNAMAARLQGSFSQLEARVVERTAELEAERARLEAVLQQMPSGVTIAEAPSGRIFLRNERVEQIWGRPLSGISSIEQYGELEGFHPDGRRYGPEEWPLMRSVHQGELVAAEEIEVPRGDDTRGTIQVNSAPIRDHDGRIVAGVAIFDDITERKRAEEALRASEERYRVVAETASDAIVMINEDSQILFLNGATEKIFGYTQTEMLGQRLTMLMPEHLREVHLASLKRYIDTGKRHLRWSSIELPGLHKSGKEIPLEVSFGEFIKESKRFFTGFLRDITERKQAEEEIRRLNEGLERRVKERTAQLERQRRTLDLILNNLSEGVLAADSGGRVVFANPSVRPMLGIGDQEQPEELPDPWRDFDLPRAVARSVANHESIEARVDGARIPLRVHLEPLPELDGERSGALVVIQDLSEERRLEVEQQRFLANAAHELKTPLTTIVGAAELLEDEQDPQLRRRFLNHISEQARRMRRLSETMLKLARVGTDLREPNLGTVDLGSVARRVAESLEPLAQKAGLAIAVEGEGSRPLADEEWLEQCLLIVLSNAIRHSERGGQIRVRAEGTTILVEDEGEGIREEDLPHIFERFYRGRGGPGGFGLGLPILKELVERMDGSISLVSEEGSGTVVKIELPEVGESV